MSLMCLIRLCSVCFIVPAVILIIRGRGRREVGALRIAYLELLTLELLTLELLTLELLTLELLTLKLLTLELLTLAPKKAIAYFAVDLLTLNTYLS
jgi:hypothetical protein